MDGKQIFSAMKKARQAYYAIDEAPQLSTTTRTNEERKDLLARHIIFQASKGWKLVAQTDFQAVMSYKEKSGHLLHFLVSVLTFGIWIFFWIFITLARNKGYQETYSIDTFGNIHIA
jgi:hypothetical protein